MNRNLRLDRNVFLPSGSHIKLTELVSLRRKLFRMNVWGKIEDFDRKYLSLTIRVLQKNLVDRVQSLKVRTLLGSIVTRIGSIRTLAMVRGRNVLFSMVANPAYRWAQISTRRWVESASSCLTVGLHSMGMIE